LLQSCYRVATNLLQSCYRVTTNLLQSYYKLATELLQSCYKLATELLQSCYKLATELLPCYYSLYSLYHVYRPTGLLQSCYSFTTELLQKLYRHYRHYSATGIFCAIQGLLMYANFCHRMSHLQCQSSYRKGHGILATVATSRFMRGVLLCLPEMPKCRSSGDPIVSRAAHPQCKILVCKVIPWDRRC